MATRLRSLIRRMIDSAGYELRRKPRGHVWGVNAFSDQVELLRHRPVATVFDVGANIGQTSTSYRRLFAGATVHAFEPFLGSYTQLSQTFAGDPQVIPHRLAVTDQTGTVEFHVNAADVTNSLFPTDPRSDKFVDPDMTAARDCVSVPAARLDDFCSDANIERIDILKLDIQGGEGRAIRGATELLGSQRIGLIYSEVLFAPLYQGQTSFTELTIQLEQRGYDLFGLYELQMMPAGLAWADAIYLPREFGRN